MAEKKMRVLMIGLKSAAVDFEKWPQLSVEKLEAAFVQVRQEVDAAGYESRWSLIGTDPSATLDVAKDIDAFDPDIVLIGAGVRTDAGHLELFEQVLNTAHAHAPRAKFAFNSLPYDTLEALKRWS